MFMAIKRKYATPKDPRKQHPALRRSVRQKVLATETHCALCSLEVDKTLPQYDPMAPEVDEIVPVALGGSPYDRANLQLTHRVCNQKKGKKLMSQLLPENINPIPTTRAW